MLASKSELDALPKDVQSEYQEKDGRFILNVEGDLPSHLELKTKVAEFRDNNVKLLKEIDEKYKPLETKLAKYEGIDADEAKRLLAEKKELEKKGIKAPNDLEKAIKDAVEAATKPLTERLETADREAKEAQRRASEVEFDRLSDEYAIKRGVRQNSLRHVRREMRDVFELKDGRLVPKPGQKHPDDPLKELDPDAFLQKLKSTDANLFAESSGGGAGGNGGGAGTGGAGVRADVKILKNPTPAEMGRHMDEIATGKMVVVRE